MKPMEEHDLKAYKKNPFNMTDWDSYSKKLEEFIDELKHIGDK